MLNSIKEAREILKKNPAKDCSNWLFHRPKLLSKFNVITGERAISEMKTVGENQIAKSKYAGAMATLRKLHDMSSDSFYDEYDYEKIDLQEIKHRILYNRPSD